jgi:hypothetical protein
MTEKSKKEINLNHDYYESVTIKVPKLIMEFLRKTDVDNIGAEAWIEERLIESVRSYLDSGVEAEELAAWFNLGPIFYAVLGEDRFKPETTDQEVKQP